MTRTILVLAGALALAPAALAMHHIVVPVQAVKSAKHGTIVGTTHRLALYTWDREKAGKVRCTGSCAMQWPPLTVMKDDMVAKHVKGVMGTVGTVVRPDGRVQVTLNGRPLYTHHGDAPATVLRDGMGGWHVVKA